jgi:hypothetical protein
MKDEISNLKQLLYSQTDFQTIKSRIENLDRLLRLYSTNQLASSSSIEVQTNVLTEFATIQLRVIEPTYNQISSYFTSEMFLGNEVIPVTVTIDTARDFLVKIINNDEVPVTLNNNSNLKLLINEDLKFRQSCEIQITGSEFSRTNKKLDLLISTKNPLGLPDVDDQSPVVETILLTDIDLPVFLNSSTSNANSAKNWKDFNFTINFNQNIVVDNNNLLEITLNENSYIVNNSVKPGDCIVINNLFIGTSSVFDFSGQYFVSTVGATNSKVVFDISTNIDFLNFVSPSLPYYLHTTNSSNLSNLPYFGLNKGKSIKITRISELDTVPIEEKYQIEVRDYDY